MEILYTRSRTLLFGFKADDGRLAPPSKKTLKQRFEGRRLIEPFSMRRGFPVGGSAKTLAHRFSEPILCWHPPWRPRRAGGNVLPRLCFHAGPQLAQTLPAPLVPDFGRNAPAHARKPKLLAARRRVRRPFAPRPFGYRGSGGRDTALRLLTERAAVLSSKEPTPSPARRKSAAERLHNACAPAGAPVSPPAPKEARPGQPSGRATLLPRSRGPWH